MNLRSLFIVIVVVSVDSSRFHHLSIVENNEVPFHLLSLNVVPSISSYQLVTSDVQLEKYFSFVNVTDLYAIRSLDRELFCAEHWCSCSSVCSIQLKILSQPQHQILFVNLTVVDLNDNVHHFRYDRIQLRIPENSNVQHRQCYRVPLVDDRDLAESNGIVYRLTGDGSELFDVDQSVGQDLCLRLRGRALDREERDRYENLLLVATDQRGEQATMKLTIQVLDVNDHSPRFATNVTTIHLNETFEGPLTCVEAFDPDEGNNGRVIYSFEQFDEKLFEYIQLNNQTGCLSILQPLFLTSPELIPLLQIDNRLLLTIRAQDGGSRMSSTLPVYHPVELIIDDVNDHRPTIQVRQILSSLDLLENNSLLHLLENTVGLLAMVTVDDIDQGLFGQVQLTLIVQSSVVKHRQAFQLKGTSTKHYKIELVHPLDRELESSLTLILQSTDGGGEETRFIISVLIDDQNDQPPRFEHEHYHFITNIQSSSVAFESTSVGQVHATDLDSSTRALIYSLNSELFVIHSETGEIRLIGPLTLNMTDRVIHLNVSVSDGEHLTSTFVTISIEGLNHRPRFPREEYFFRIDENLPIRTIVGRITGEDDDSPSTRRGELTYSLQSLTPHSEFFFHTSHTGEILVTRVPDAEQQQLHRFLVTVRDHGLFDFLSRSRGGELFVLGTPPLSSEARLTIAVTDLNEFCPQLVNVTSEPYLFVSRQRFLKKHPTEKFTYRLRAFDFDISDQSNITFESVDSASFHLDAQGLLTIRELPARLPSIVEFTYSMHDTFVSQPCRREEKLIVLFGEVNGDRERLIDEYQRQVESSQEHRLITAKLATNKRKKHETWLIFFAFSLSTLIIGLGIGSLLLVVCCRRENKERPPPPPPPRTLIDEERKEQSPHSFITDENGKSSLLRSLR